MATNGANDDPARPVADDLPAIPDVTLQRELARGGMGIVYRGRQDFLERDVAVKLLAPQWQGERFAARFRREARLLAGIKHPHIVACYAAGVTPAGQHYLVMELVEGPTLAQWIARHGPVPVPAAARLVDQLAMALGHACDLGVIHRDVKTANILLEAPTGTAIDPSFPFVPKLVDLGLARMAAADPDLAQTAPGAVMGTPATMAPEQFDAPDQVDFRADLYGLGCVLYEMLTGEVAYADQRLTDLVVAKRQPRGPDPCARRRDIPAPLGQLVTAMLAQNPQDRPADYRTLRERLDAAARAPVAMPPVAAAGSPPSGPGLLQTAEFEFLAAGGPVATPPAADAAFVSQIVAPPAAPPAPPAKVATAPKPRVIGARATAQPTPARGARRWLAIGTAAAVATFAAVPLLHRTPPTDAEPLAPAAATTPAPATGIAAANHRPEVELLGVSGELRRGHRYLLRSRSHDADGDTLQYQWSVQPPDAATLATPTDESTALQHARLPGDEFTIALAVRDGRDVTTTEQHVAVRYPPQNLLADFLAPDGPWQPGGRLRLAWRQREDGTVVANALDLPCLRTYALTGAVWRIGGRLVPERADVRGTGHTSYAQAAVGLRLTPQRQIAIVGVRDGANGEHWTLSVQQIVRDDARGNGTGNGFALRAIPEAVQATVEATNPSAARFTLTRRGRELRLAFGFGDQDLSGLHIETLGEEPPNVGLILIARGGRVLFPELSLW